MLTLQLLSLTYTHLSVPCSRSRSNSRHSSPRSTSPPSFSPQRGRSRPLSKRGGRVRGRGRNLRHSDGSVNATSPENKQPVGKRGGRKSLMSRLGATAKKKGYLPLFIDVMTDIRTTILVVIFQVYLG